MTDWPDHTVSVCRKRVANLDASLQTHGGKNIVKHECVKNDKPKD